MRILFLLRFCLRSDDLQTKECADTLYQNLLNEKIDVIYDDRNVRAGVMFSDADLLGVPIRIIVSPKNLQESCVEIITSDKIVNMKVSITETIITVTNLITKLTNEIAES
jgi:prolyl-tRNA synthetase